MHGLVLLPIFVFFSKESYEKSVWLHEKTQSMQQQQRQHQQSSEKKKWKKPQKCSISNFFVRLLI